MLQLLCLPFCSTTALTSDNKKTTYWTCRVFNWQFIFKVLLLRMLCPKHSISFMVLYSFHGSHFFITSLLCRIPSNISDSAFLYKKSNQVFCVKGFQCLIATIRTQVSWLRFAKNWQRHWLLVFLFVGLQKWYAAQSSEQSAYTQAADHISNGNGDDDDFFAKISTQQTYVLHTQL